MKKLILLSIILFVGCDEGDSVVYSDTDINLPIAHPQCKVEYKYYTTTDEIVDTYILCYDNISEAMCLYYATEGCQDKDYIDMNSVSYCTDHFISYRNSQTDCLDN